MGKLSNYCLYKFYAIIPLMHKKFYASGFLYHPTTRQILLQQQKETQDTKTIWLLVGGISKSRETPQAAFKRLVQKLLRTKLSLKAIESVYFYKDIDTDHYILYAETKKMKKSSPKNQPEFAWFTFKQVLKLQVDAQTKHDIVVSQRVIDSKTRKRLGQHTLE